MLSLSIGYMKFLFPKLFITILGAEPGLSVPFIFLLNSFFVPFRDLKGNMQRNFLIVVVGGHLISLEYPSYKKWSDVYTHSLRVGGMFHPKFPKCILDGTLKSIPLRKSGGRVMHGSLRVVAWNLCLFLNNWHDLAAEIF
jgi:hypothetical protein